LADHAAHNIHHPARANDRPVRANDHPARASGVRSVDSTRTQGRVAGVAARIAWSIDGAQSTSPAGSRSNATCARPAGAKATAIDTDDNRTAKAAWFSTSPSGRLHSACIRQMSVEPIAAH